MTFRRSAPAALIVAVIIVVAGLTFVTHRLFSGLTSSIETSQFQLMQSILDTALRNAADDALARADIVASLAETRQALAAKDRERLKAVYSDMFAVQKERRGVDQVQFHVPPAISLLRLHAPQQFGDDLTRFRPIVASVNRERAPRGGLAIAAGGPAIFGVTPVRDMQGNHAGSVEFGLNFGPLLDGLKASYGLDFTLFVEEKALRDFATGIDRAILSDQNRVGRFIRFHTTNAALARELATDADIATVNEPARYTRQVQGTPYGALAVPLRDGAGDSLGMIVVSRDFGGSRAAEGRSLVWQICMAIFAIVILAGTILVVIRGFLLRPLDVVDRHFAALAAGEPAGPIEGSGKFCAEMQSLVSHYDALRAQTAEQAR